MYDVLTVTHASSALTRAFLNECIDHHELSLEILSSTKLFSSDIILQPMYCEKKKIVLVSSIRLKTECASFHPPYSDVH